MKTEHIWRDFARWSTNIWDVKTFFGWLVVQYGGGGTFLLWLPSWKSLKKTWQTLSPKWNFQLVHKHFTVGSSGYQLWNAYCKEDTSGVIGKLQIYYHIHLFERDFSYTLYNMFSINLMPFNFINFSITNKKKTILINIRVNITFY